VVTKDCSLAKGEAMTQRILILVVLGGLASNVSVGARDAAYSKETRGAENAAVQYLRADLSLRQSYALAADAASTFQKALDGPLNEEDEKLAAAAEEALVEFGHGARAQRCVWDVSLEDGALASTAHRGAIRELVLVSGIRARLRFRANDAEGALEDLLSAMAASRHLTLDGSLASVLIGYRLENSVSNVLARNLHRIAPERLRQLQRDMERLPTG